MADVKIDIELAAGQAIAQLQLLNKQVSSLQSSFKRINASQVTGGLNDAGKAASKAGGQFNNFGKIATNVAKSFIAFQAVRLVIGAFTTAVQATTEFEDALLGVQKTTNISGDSLKIFGNELLTISKRLPVSARELAELATTAGQLGIRGSQNLAKFAETMARLRVATDVAGEEGARSIARILNITKSGPEVVDRFGAALVDLGNNVAATEGEILGVANELGRASAQFGLNAQQVLGLSATIKELGGRAEGSGTQIGKVFREMSKAIASGGKQLELFTELTGTSTSEFSRLLREDASQALVKFLSGLNKLTKEDGSRAVIVMKQLGLGTDRAAKILPLLAQNVDRVTENIQRSNRAWSDNNALSAESNRAFTSLSRQWQTFTNNVTALAVELGNSIVQFSGVRDTLQFFTELMQKSSKTTNDLKTELTAKRQELEQLERAYRALGGPVDSTTSKLQGLLGATKDSTGSFDSFANVIKTAASNILNLNAAEKAQQRILSLRNEIKALQNELTQTDQVAGQQNKPAGDIPNNAEYKSALDQRFSLFDKYLEALDVREEEKRAADELRQDMGFIALQERLGEENALKLTNEIAQEQLRVESIKNEEDRQKALEKFKIDSEARILQAVRRAEVEKAEAAKQQAQIRLQAAQQFFGALTSLTAEKERGLFEIGKAAAVAQAIVNTYAGATKALEQLGAFGPPVAAAIVAGGLLNVRRIASQSPPSFEDGGIVPGNSFSGDKVAARVNSGEMILNRQQQVELFKMANGQSESDSREIISHVTVELDGEVVGRAVSRQVADGLKLGEVV